MQHAASPQRQQGRQPRLNAVLAGAAGWRTVVRASIASQHALHVAGARVSATRCNDHLEFAANGAIIPPIHCTPATTRRRGRQRSRRRRPCLRGGLAHRLAVWNTRAPQNRSPNRLIVLAARGSNPVSYISCLLSCAAHSRRLSTSRRHSEGSLPGVETYACSRGLHLRQTVTRTRRGRRPKCPLSRLQGRSPGDPIRSTDTPHGRVVGHGHRDRHGSLQLRRVRQGDAGAVRVRRSGNRLSCLQRSREHSRSSRRNINSPARTDNVRSQFVIGPAEPR